MPQFIGRHTIFHGFGRGEAETPQGVDGYTWWGSDRFKLPEDTRETNVRLQAEDGAHSSGILYSRGGETTVVVFNHPRADFSSHYLTPMLVEAGFAIYGGQTRYLGNDINCEHECLCADIAAQVRYLKAKGFEKVVLCGNSGGGPLSTFYMAQANTPIGQRLTTTAAGNPYDLNDMDLPPVDGLISLAGALSEGAVGLANLDPSVIDEDDPLSCDPDLDMFDPANGYRRPPEVSRYSEAFLTRYRAAQVERCRRIDARAKQEVARKRKFRALMTGPDFENLPLREQNHITRQAVTCNTIVTYRTMADPALTDLSLEPNKRSIFGLMQPDPQVANWSIPGLVQVTTAEGWLSTWSGLSTQVNMHEDAKRITQPLLSISFSADVTILPFVGKGLYDNAAAADKTYMTCDGDHFAFCESGERDAGIVGAADTIIEWLMERFPGRCQQGLAGGPRPR